MLLALRRWRARLSGAKVMLSCDNAAVVAGISHSSIKGQAMAPLRDIVLILAADDVVLEPVWISTEAKRVADSLSRRRLDQVANLLPQLNLHLDPQTE